MPSSVWNLLRQESLHAKGGGVWQEPKGFRSCRGCHWHLCIKSLPGSKILAGSALKIIIAFLSLAMSTGNERYCGETTGDKNLAHSLNLLGDDSKEDLHVPTGSANILDPVDGPDAGPTLSLLSKYVKGLAGCSPRVHLGMDCTCWAWFYSSQLLHLRDLANRIV